MREYWRGLCISVTFYGTLLACLVAFSEDSDETNSAQAVPVISLSDPLLASLADPDADPTKAAGIVGEKPGLANGEPDPELAKQIQNLEKMNDAADSALEKDLPEPEPEPAPAEPVPAPETKPAQAVPVAKPAPAEPQKVAPKKTPAPVSEKKSSPEKKTSAGTTQKPKRISFKDWKKNSGGKAGKTSKKSTAGKSSSGKGKVSVAKIDVSKIGVGNVSGSGKNFGVAGGTGGNGGDGGRAIASAQQAYAAEIAREFGRHLDAILAQDPLTLDGTMNVSVRLNVASDGTVRLLEVVGSSDPKVRERVARAVARIGKFRAPPEKKAFPILVPEVSLRPL